MRIHATKFEKKKKNERRYKHLVAASETAAPHIVTWGARVCKMLPFRYSPSFLSVVVVSTPSIGLGPAPVPLCVCKLNILAVFGFCIP